MDVIKELQSIARGIISEWVGYDLPTPGDMDYAAYINSYSEVEAFSSVQDFLDFIESRGISSVDYQEIIELGS